MPPHSQSAADDDGCQTRPPPVRSPMSPSTAVATVPAVTHTDSKVNHAASGYFTYLAALRRVWGDLPDLTITYHQLSAEVTVPLAQLQQKDADGERAEVTTVPQFLRHKAVSMAKHLTQKLRIGGRHTAADATTGFFPLEPASGIIQPGELTLILAPPGHGKSTLLKALSGRMSIDGRRDAQLHGDLRWNGRTADECAASGIKLGRLAAFVEQADIHYPLLTVRETLQFAVDNSNADLSLLTQETIPNSPATATDLDRDSDLLGLHGSKVDLLLSLLGLTECADTIVGNSLIRGISGGQRRRLTLGEMLATNARALFLDEISTGLDAAGTFDIVQALRNWTRLMRGSATVALLQPAPEVVALFDKIILMREGHVVFHGSRSQIDDFFRDGGVTPDPEKDIADWIVAFLAEPQSHATPSNCDATVAPTDSQAPFVLEQSKERDPSLVRFHLDDSDSEYLVHPEGDIPAIVSGSASAGVTAPVSTTPAAMVTTADMLRVFHASEAHRDLEATLSAALATLKHDQSTASTSVAPMRSSRSAFSHQQFESTTVHSFWWHAWLALKREMTSATRNKDVNVYRIGQAIVVGLIMGSLYYDLSPSDVSSRYGVMVWSILMLSFSPLSEVAIGIEHKLVLFKQLDAGFYSTGAFMIAATIASIPIAIAECLLLCTSIYWLASFTATFGAYLFFMLISLATGLMMSSVYRLIIYWVSSADVAMAIINPVTIIQVFFAGLLITPDKIPDWQIFLYWSNPFTYALNSLALNEFESSKYTSEQSDAFLHVYRTPRGDAIKWASIPFQFGLLAFFTIVSAVMLQSTRSWLTVGTRRTQHATAGRGQSPDTCTTEKADVTVIEMAAIGSGASAPSPDHASDGVSLASPSHPQMPFVPVSLTWTDICYEARVTERDDDGIARTYDRSLLSGISGYARAGELTALMGSSGAGKTTLLDVLAGRKASGAITGSILVNGHPQSFPTFSRLLGFVQQMDMHVSTQTVREAVEFSAQLRLPSTVSEEARAALVEQILFDLELDTLAGRPVGDAINPGLSVCEMKRLTIAVEMAANPSILFLDEPTSGLDARAALVVLRVIRNIARRGRAVVCTIHQPSADLFGMFDRLLLLRTGGRLVYFGPSGGALIDYFLHTHNKDGVALNTDLKPLAAPEHGVNPAVWMLHVITSSSAPPYSELYKATALCSENEETMRAVSRIDAGSEPPSFESRYASSSMVQLRLVIRRIWLHTWRSPEFMLSRLLATLLMGLALGIVFVQLDDSDESGMLSMLALLFSAPNFIGYTFGITVQSVVFDLREAFYRERESNMYAPWMHAVAMIMTEVPWIVVATVIAVVPVFFMVGLKATAENFFHFLLVTFLAMWMFTSANQWCAAVVPSLAVARLASELTLTIWMLFGGYFIQKHAIPEPWQWLYHLSPLAKSFIAVLIKQYHCDGDECPKVWTLAQGEISKSDLADYYVSSGDPWQYYYLGWLALTVVILQGLFVITTHKIVHNKA